MSQNAAHWLNNLACWWCLKNPGIRPLCLWISVINLVVIHQLFYDVHSGQKWNLTWNCSVWSCTASLRCHGFSLQVSSAIKWLSQTLDTLLYSHNECSDRYLLPSYCKLLLFQRRLQTDRLDTNTTCELRPSQEAGANTSRWIKLASPHSGDFKDFLIFKSFYLSFFMMKRWWFVYFAALLLLDVKHRICANFRG